MFQRTTERGELEIFYKNQMTTNKHECDDWREKMSCHYLNIVIIKMYINNMFCGSIQLIELLSWSEENEAKDNMTESEAQWKSATTKQNNASNSGEMANKNQAFEM